ncbi:MAG: hypothetical protein WCK90_02765 [archaeon]
MSLRTKAWNAWGNYVVPTIGACLIGATLWDWSCPVKSSKDVDEVFLKDFGDRKVLVTESERNDFTRHTGFFFSDKNDRKTVVECRIIPAKGYLDQIVGVSTNNRGVKFVDVHIEDEYNGHATRVEFRPGTLVSDIEREVEQAFRQTYKPENKVNHGWMIPRDFGYLGGRGEIEVKEYIGKSQKVPTRIVQRQIDYCSFGGNRMGKGYSLVVELGDMLATSTNVNGDVQLLCPQRESFASMKEYTVAKEKINNAISDVCVPNNLIRHYRVPKDKNGK